MGRVNKNASSGDLRRLPSGSFTVDSLGQVVSSTVPQAVPSELVGEIGRSVVHAFQEARKANLAFSEMVAQYATFKITAREMRGGAIIFLSPKAPQRVSSS